MTGFVLQDLVIILEVMRIIAVALSPIAPCLSLRIYSVDQFNSITWVINDFLSSDFKN